MYFDRLCSSECHAITIGAVVSLVRNIHIDLFQCDLKIIICWPTPMYSDKILKYQN